MVLSPEPARAAKTPPFEEPGAARPDNERSGLRVYRDRRLELADMLRAALHLAHSRGDAGAENRARDLLARLAADRFRLAVIGQFSRGKSTLMNALLGGAYLPMGALPMTSVITTVRYGARPRAMIRRHQAALPVEVPLAQVADYVAASSVRRAEMRVAVVEVEVPAQILRLGFEFVDTPGIGSSLAANTAATRQFIPQADAVIFVTGFDSPLTEAEAGLLADASRHSGRLFFILNKRDLVGDRDAGQVQDFVRLRLRDLGAAAPRVYGVSALEALEGVVGNDQDRLSASGVPGLRADLELFLTAGKARLFLDNVAGGAARLVSAQRQDLLLGRLTRDRGTEVPEIMAPFDARVQDLAARQHAAAAVIADRAGADLPGLTATRSMAWRQELRELLDPLAREALPASDGGDSTVRTSLEAGRASLERAGREVTGSWLQRKTGEVQELLTGLVGGEIGVLLETSRSPAAIGARLAGLPGASDRREPAGWSVEDLPDLAVRMPGWSIPMELPRHLPRKAGPGDPRVRRYLTDALAAAITAFEEQARARFADAAVDWAARLEDRAGRQLTAAAEWFRHCVRTPPDEDDLAALDDLTARLGALRSALATAASPAEEAAAQVTANGEASRAGRGGCAVCAQMEETLTRQLRRGQFLLATRDADQARLTRAGGYCPVHTWQYASIASPLGISAGYAKLATAVADTLQSLSQDDRAPQDLGRAVAALSPGPAGCALCQALAARERDAVAEAAAHVPDSPLCLRHLALTLTAGPAPAAGRAMIRALAAALRTDSEDMRDYALKREALHNWLVTDEESRAHQDALRWLAGLSALTMPWADTDL
jgi:dynamin family protein